jgi:predicted metal-dependent hydrolase
VAGFVVTTGALASFVAFEWGRCVLEDRRRITGSHRRRFWSNLRRQKLLSPWFVRNVVTYLRPGFHPDDTDTDALVAAWRERLGDVATVQGPSPRRPGSPQRPASTTGPAR